MAMDLTTWSKHEHEAVLNEVAKTLTPRLHSRAQIEERACANLVRCGPEQALPSMIRPLKFENEFLSAEAMTEIPMKTNAGEMTFSKSAKVVLRLALQH